MRKAIKFDSKGQEAFYATLRTRVHELLHKDGGSTKGGTHMVVKAIVLISAHFSLYGLMISGFFEPYWHIY